MYDLRLVMETLDSDPERPEPARAQAREQVASACAGGDAVHALKTLFGRIGALTQHPMADDPLAKGLAFPELLGPVEDLSARAPGYHELHCHFRGGVPFEAIWLGWIHDARWRASLRKVSLGHNGWRRTIPELVEVAADLRESLSTADLPAPAWGAGEGEHLPVLAERRWLRALVETERAKHPAWEIATRYLVIYAAVRHHLMHQRGIPGLPSFVRSFGTFSASQKPVGAPHHRHSRLQLIALLRRFQNDGAVAVEVRPTLEDTRRGTAARLRNLVLGYLEYLTSAGEGAVAMGIVPSLLKQEALSKRPPHDWALQTQRWSEQAEALCVLLEEWPWLRRFVVGLDAAGQERGCSMQAMQPAFEVVRRFNFRHGVSGRAPGVALDVGGLQRRLGAACPSEVLEALTQEGAPWSRLGLTMHAGEDFVHPLTGLRHIWEALRVLELRRGDRLGHALAASLEPELLDQLLTRRAHARGELRTWRAEGERVWRVSVPRTVRLLDLCWVSECLPQDRAVMMELANLATRVFVGGHGLDRLALGARGPGPQPLLPLPQGRFKAPEEVSEAEREEVVLDETELLRFERLRHRVLTEMTRRDVVVESCPTSNRIVANLERPPAYTFMQVPNLRWVVATDDPGLFETWPAQELTAIPEDRRASAIEATRQASFVKRVRSV